MQAVAAVAVQAVAAAVQPEVAEEAVAGLWAAAAVVGLRLAVRAEAAAVVGLQLAARPGGGGGGGPAVSGPPGRGAVGMGGRPGGAPSGTVVGRGSGHGNWRSGRSHFHRGPVVTYGFGAYDYPYYYYDYPNYQGADCWQLRTVRGRYRRVWVCD